VLMTFAIFEAAIKLARRDRPQNVSDLGVKLWGV